MRALTIRSICAVVLLVSATVAPVLGAGTAYLGELMPWPMPAAAIAGRAIELQDTPCEEIDWHDPLATDASFGLFSIGSGDDRGITLAVLRTSQGPPLVIVDCDNDESLDDEAWLSCPTQHGVQTYNWYVTVMAEYSQPDSPSGVLRAPYRISLLAQYLYQLDDLQFFYAGFCHLSGAAEIDGEIYSLGISSASSNGLYNDIDDLTIAIDVDRDGILDDTPYSHEVFRPGESIRLASGVYAVSQASESGRMLKFERIGAASSVPQRIAKGLDAPRFAAQSVDGEQIDFRTFPTSEQATIVLFVQFPSGCSTCSQGKSSSAVQRFNDVYSFNSDLGDNVRFLVVVASTTPPDVSVFDVAGGTTLVDFVWDSTVNALYRRDTGLIVVDRNGTIVAMDEVWGTLKEGIPFYYIESLSGADVRYVVEGLILP